MEIEIEKEIQKLSLHIIRSNLRKNLLKEKSNLQKIDPQLWREVRNSHDDYIQYKNIVHSFTQIHRSSPLDIRNELDAFLSDEHFKNLPKFFSFLNRCTIKLLEMDQKNQFVISHAHLQTGSNQLKFLDLCGGPGGFVEYLLFIHKWKCKGLGVTLRGPLNYKLIHFNQNAPSDTFLNLNSIFEEEEKNQNQNNKIKTRNKEEKDEQNTINDLNIKKQLPQVSISNTGSIFEKSVEEKFKFIIQNYFKEKVDLILADGAMGEGEGEWDEQYRIMNKNDDKDQKNEDKNEDKNEEQNLLIQIQEIYNTCKYLAPKGICLFKMFDITQPQTIRLVYFLHIVFEKIKFLKYDMSRPVNSERYLLCEQFCPRKLVLNQKMNNNNNNDYWNNNLTIDILKKYILEGKNENLFEDSKIIFQNVAFSLTQHLLETWKIQENTLKEWINECKNRAAQCSIFGTKNASSKSNNYSTKECLKLISEYWNKWNLAWYHNLNQEIPHTFFNFYQKEKKENIKKIIPLYDNWNQLYHNTKFLSAVESASHYQISHENVRIVYTSKSQNQIGKLYDITLQPIDPTTTLLKSLCKYPANTMVLVYNDIEIRKIIALPLYPKLFEEKDSKEIKEKWTLFYNNICWWINTQQI